MAGTRPATTKSFDDFDRCYFFAGGGAAGFSSGLAAGLSMRYVEKSVLLQTLDHLWREHLVMLEHLRQVIGLRGYGQRDPLNEYKAEAFALFETMVAHLREAVTAQLMRVEVVQTPPAEEASQLPYMVKQK